MNIFHFDTFGDNFALSLLKLRIFSSFKRTNIVVAEPEGYR